MAKVTNNDIMEVLQALTNTMTVVASSSIEQTRMLSILVDNMTVAKTPVETPAKETPVKVDAPKKNAPKGRKSAKGRDSKAMSVSVAKTPAKETPVKVDAPKTEKKRIDKLILVSDKMSGGYIAYTRKLEKSEHISKKVTYAFGKICEEAKGVKVTGADRDALVKMTGNKYVVGYKFSRKKDAQSLADAFNA